MIPRGVLLVPLLCEGEADCSCSNMLAKLIRLLLTFCHYRDNVWTHIYNGRYTDLKTSRILVVQHCKTRSLLVGQAHVQTVFLQWRHARVTVWTRLTCLSGTPRGRYPGTCFPTLVQDWRREFTLQKGNSVVWVLRITFIEVPAGQSTWTALHCTVTDLQMSNGLDIYVDLLIRFFF